MGGTCRDSGWGLIEEPAPSQAFVDHVIQLKIPPRRRHRQKDGLMDEWLEGRAASLMEALYVAARRASTIDDKEILRNLDRQAPTRESLQHLPLLWTVVFLRRLHIPCADIRIQSVGFTPPGNYFQGEWACEKRANYKLTYQLVAWGGGRELERRYYTPQGVRRHLGFRRTLKRLGLLKTIACLGEGPLGDDEASRSLTPSHSLSRPSLLSREAQPTSSSSSSSLLASAQVRLAGRRHRFLRNPAKLKEVLRCLMLASAARRPPPTTLQDAIEETKAWGEVLKKLPSFMGMGGTYIQPHCTGKRLIALASQLPAGTWGSESALDLVKVIADRSGALAPLITMGGRGCDVSEVERVFECQPWLVAMWACLWKEPSKTWGADEVARVLAKRPLELERVASEYQRKHGLPPCPFVAMEEFLGRPLKRPRQDPHPFSFPSITRFLF